MGFIMKQGLLFSLGLIGQIGFSVAIPLVAFALFGRWLDRQFHSGNDFFFAGIVIATILIYFILRKIIKEAINNFK